MNIHVIRRLVVQGGGEWWLDVHRLVSGCVDLRSTQYPIDIYRSSLGYMIPRISSRSLVDRCASWGERDGNMTIHGQSMTRNGRMMVMATLQCSQIINKFIFVTADNSSSAIAFVITQCHDTDILFQTRSFLDSHEYQLWSEAAENSIFTAIQLVIKFVSFELQKKCGLKFCQSFVRASNLF